MAKKKFTFLKPSEKKLIIDNTDPTLSVSRQAQLVSLSRSSIYYEPRIDFEELTYLRALDKAYTKYPFYGSRRLKLVRADEYQIYMCREQVQRLMHVLGIQALYPKHKTTIPAQGHKIYPYLLKNLSICRVNQVWGTDSTYLPLEHGFCYLVAIIDWFSRYVVSWELSETMTTEFCARSLTSALAQARSEIHNSDQGSQFTSMEYTNILKNNNIQISMDGRGRCLDNIFTERLWRTVKYEDIYLKQYRTIEETYEGLAQYFPFYNNKRRHQSLGYKTPQEIYFS
ncbi:MAG: IS3 family transposase [Candidatus Magasanikbacteria bacterium]|nr:IS3 family transposase [Candidatus Magasanikbacteria bacterium]